MPIVVSCRCGKKFAAKDHLAGQQVPCPACGRSLTIAAATSAASQGIYVSCACGRAFMAPESLRGKQTKCPGCHGVINVPAHAADADPLGLGPVASSPDPFGQLHPSVPMPQAEAEIPWDTLKWIIGGGVTLLVLLIVTLSTINYMRSDPQLADADAATRAPTSTSTSPATTSPSPAPATTNLPPAPSSTASPSPSLPPVAPVTSTPSTESTANLTAPATTPRANITGKTASAADSNPVTRLPDGIREWHSQPEAKLSGIRRANATDPPLAHFSWLTGLLPFVGQKKLYDEFDFSKEIKGKNLQLAGYLVPEFLNPLDDYQRWRGYPFPGIALTHFVGISGIEDARNVVAARLPRTDPRAGVFGYDQVARPADITDGQSQTVMVAGAGNLANPWIFGGGATIRGAREPIFDPKSGLGTKGLAGGGSIVVMADGSVRHISANVDPRVFKAMCTIHGADTVDLDQSSQPFDLKQLGPFKLTERPKTSTTEP